MAEFINSLTGTRMWVAPERAEEYVRAGHRPVEDSCLLYTSDAADD